ncbi:MAG TPA: glucokinase [Gammaproteobacteria bacterium]|nr:glucokinase [Gammaproteobacteria bacterium]
MGEPASRREIQTLSAADAPFIAADVGGTHARVGLVRSDGHGHVAVLRYRTYACSDYPDLAAILQAFIERETDAPVDCVALACAGCPVDGVVVNANLSWPVSIEDLRKNLGIRDLLLINDFEAVAHATRFVDSTATLLLAGPEHGDGPVLVVGPGTGLGSAVCIPGQPRPTVLATEAGQINLAPVTARERDVLAALAGDSAYVPYEQILSGPGLCTLYGVLSRMAGLTPALDAPEAVTAAALAGSDATAVVTLEMFCALLGSFVGNLVMLYGAGGGVYLTGGILPHICGFLKRSDFMPRFLDKGGMRTFLERVPVRLMEHGQLGVIGAAGWTLDNIDSIGGHGLDVAAL